MKLVILLFLDMNRFIILFIGKMTTYAGIGAGAHGYITGTAIQISVRSNSIWTQ